MKPVIASRASMNRKLLLEKITRAAKRDRQHRRDLRFLTTMGFLVAKGLLRTNQDIPLLPNARIRIDDAIWAGVNVEPRILEVLPAAVLRLQRHFDLDLGRHPDLADVVARLKRGEKEGPEFLGVAYGKLKVWVDYPLRDGRMKQVLEKKITKTYRLKPEVVAGLKRMSKEQGCSETEALERAVLK